MFQSTSWTDNNFSFQIHLLQFKKKKSFIGANSFIKYWNAEIKKEKKNSHKLLLIGNG